MSDKCKVLLCVNAVANHNYCDKHLKEMVEFGDPLYSVKKQMLVLTGIHTAFHTTMNPDNLKALELYTPYDVAEWAHGRGMKSLYASRQKATSFRSYGKSIRTPFSVTLLDYAQPGEVLHRFFPHSERTVHELDTTANFYVQANYDTPLTFLRSMKTQFPDSVVRSIQMDMVYLQRVWGSKATTEVAIPEEDAERVLQSYSKPRVEFLSTKLVLV